MSERTVIIAAATLAVAWGALWGCYPEDTDHAMRDTKTTATQPYTQRRTSPEPQCGHGTVTITSPKDGTTLGDGRQGLELKGTVCLPRDTTLWEIESRNGKLLIGNNAGPIADTSGNIDYQTGPLGKRGDLLQPVIIRLVFADIQCTTALSVQTDKAPTAIPPGCRVARSVTVKVSDPPGE